MKFGIFKPEVSHHICAVIAILILLVTYLGLGGFD
jgi:hypothetical protein